MADDKTLLNALIKELIRESYRHGYDCALIDSGNGVSEKDIDFDAARVKKTHDTIMNILSLMK